MSVLGFGLHTKLSLHILYILVAERYGTKMAICFQIGNSDTVVYCVYCRLTWLCCGLDGQWYIYLAVLRL
jgi:hypothetical protein